MGKLHTLKRAILRNPEIWKEKNWSIPVPIKTNKNSNGNWEVCKWYTPKKSYRRFVRSVLKTLPGG